MTRRVAPDHRKWTPALFKAEEKHIEGHPVPRTARPLNLQFLAQKFKNDVAEERGYHRDGKIGGGKNIFDCARQAVLLPDA